MNYPIYRPEITAREKELVNECLDSTWISSRGRFIEEFEGMVASYIGAGHAIAVMNGTVALHLALLAAGVGPGDEVIVPDFTYLATANAVRYIGATPVVVDVDPASWNITAETIAPAITARTRAIVTVDIYGTPADMDPIMALAEAHGLVVVEDAAESLGASYRGRMAGTLGHIGVLSFFGNKTITTGEGGMVVVNRHETSALVRKLRNQGNSETVRYWHDILGYNYRMTNLQAAIGCAQMERIQAIVARKREIQALYESELEGLVTFQELPPEAVSSYWMVSFMVKDGVTRDRLRSGLEAQGIETRPFFFPVHAMPFYEKMDHPVTCSLTERGLNVPSYHGLSDADVLIITRAIRTILGVSA